MKSEMDKNWTLDPNCGRTKMVRRQVVKWPDVEMKKRESTSEALAKRPASKKHGK